jgi:hypothetical protein
MSNQIVISSGAKVRDLNGVLTGTSGIVSSVPLGAANGVATLDSGGKVPVSQLPSSVVTYLGTWNAATNTPTLVNGTGDAGDMYICNVAGTVNFGAGPVTFAVGDWVLYGSGTWQKSNGQNGTVTSVAVTESGDALTITGSPITTAGTINIGFAGTSGQYVNGAGGLTTFPSLTGFVPYTGATASVDLGAFSLTADTLNSVGIFSIGSGTQSGYIGIKQGTTFLGNISGYNSINANATKFILISDIGSTNYKSASFQLSSLTNNTERTFTLPDITGTLALLEGTQTFTGVKSFDTGILLKNGFITTASGYTGIGAGTSGINISLGTGGGGSLIFQSTGYNYTFPAASGTLALTSDIPSVSGTATYIPVFTGANSLGNSQIWNNAGIIGMGTNYSSPAFSVVASSGDTLTQGKLAINTTSFSGTSVLQVNGAATITGGLTGTSASFTTSGGSDTFAINHSSGSGIALNITKGGNGEGLYINKTSGSGNAATIIGTLNATTLVKSGGTSSQFLMADGSVNTSVLPSGAYLPLTGGTLTGALIGTTATFSGTVSSIVTSGGTSFRVVNSVNSRAWSLVPSTNGAESDLWLYYGGTGTGTKVAFLNNGNVGINTTNPTYTLDVDGTGRFTGALTGTSATFSGNVFALNYYGTDNANLIAENTNTNGTVLTLNSKGTVGIIKLQTNSTDRLTLSASGNLGLGVTPSAWQSPFIGFQIGNQGAALSGRSDVEQANFSSNWYFNAGSKYIINGYSTLYQQTNGTHAWYNAPSGTAGNAISFTQAMTLTAAGRLLLGTTTESTYLLDVNGTGRFSGDLLTTGNIEVDSTNKGLVLSKIYVGGKNAVVSDVNGDLLFNSSTSGFNNLRFTGPAIFSSDITTTDGQVKLRTTNKLILGYDQGGGASLNYNGNGNLDITPRSGYDTVFTAGNVGIGTTPDAGVRLHISGGVIRSIDTYNNTSANVANMYVSSGGTFERATASSARFKENIINWNGNGLDTILALKPKTFKYKKDYYNKADIEFLGLIAEDVAEVSPYLADYENEDRTGQVENVRYATIVVPLIKAVQELEARIKQLENK